MTSTSRAEQLKFCKICANRISDLQQGIICGLTNKKADFEETCISFEENMEIKNELDSQIRDAGKGKRFANYLLDLVFFYIFTFVFGIVIAIILLVISPSSLSVLEEDNVFLEYLLGFIAGMIYYSTFEAITGRTLAKFITGTKVVTLEGEKPDYRTILIRSAYRFVPFEAFSFLGDDDSGWHDRWSQTRVIEV